MDTSETYIKMSDKAKELWQYRETRVGDFLVVDGKVGVYPQVWSINSIPLFRQDQLQTMAPNNDQLWPAFIDFEFFCFEERTWTVREYAYQFTSMEQLWLAFVMKEKYNKTWNGEDWVNHARQGTDG